MTHCIKNVVFDLGNVLLTYHPLEFMQTILGDRETGRACYELIIESREWKELDGGRLSVDEARQRFIEREPSLAEGIQTFFEQWFEMFQPIPESIQILDRLKADGYRLYVLSNFIRESFEAIRPRFSFLDRFDGMVISYRVGASKPDRAIYEYLLHTYNLIPKETLFIDDLEANAQGARDAGIAAIRFQSPQQLHNELSRLGLI